MLSTMRKPFAKVLTIILFGFLILSFAIWGIGDVIRGVGQNPAVIEVADQTVDERAFAEAFSRNLNALRQRFGTDIDAAQAQALGVVNQTIQDLVTRSLFDAEAESLGMRVSEEQLKAALLKEQAFQTAGSFDRQRFFATLRNLGLSEEGYLLELSEETDRRRLVSALDGAEPPKPLVEALFKYAGEKRDADYVAVPRPDPASIAAPEDEEVLKQAYQDSLQLFQSPELRSGTALVLDLARLAREITVTDEELKEAYEARLEELSKPEQRSFRQTVFADQAAAEAFAKELAEGREISSAAAALETPQDVVSLSDVTRPTLESQSPALAEAVFAVAEGGVFGPTESAFGWHVGIVDRVQAEATPSLEEVRDSLSGELALGRATDEIVTIANQLDDLLASGASLEEAGDRLGFDPVAFSEIDDEGKDAAGAPVEGLPGDPLFLQLVFETPAGETSLLTESDGGSYFVVRVDGATPPAPRPFDDVRDQVLAAWQAGEAQSQAEEKAKALLEALDQGGDLAALASAEGLAVETATGVARNGQGAPGAGAAAFAESLFGIAEPGEAAVASGNEGAYLVRLTAIEEADPAAQAAAVKQLADSLGQSLRSDLLASYTNALRDEHGVTVNFDAVNRVIESY